MRTDELRLFADMSAEAREEILQRTGGGVRRFGKGEVIVHEGTRAKWLVPVLSGVISVYEPGANGERHLVARGEIAHPCHGRFAMLKQI